MPDDLGGFQVRTVAQRMAIGDRDHVVIVRDRGAHSRIDHVGMREAWDGVNVAARREGGAMVVRTTPTLALPDELRSLVAVKE